MHDHKKIIKTLEPLSPTIEDADFDLDAELAKASAMQEEKAVVEEQLVQETNESQDSPEEQIKKQILSYLKDNKLAPSTEQIMSWKEKYGEHGVMVISFDPGNVFVYTHLTNGQWEKINQLAKSYQNKADMTPDTIMKRSVIKQAILWPKINDTWFENCRAGLPNTLYEQILINSYFLTASQALTLTTTL